MFSTYMHPVGEGRLIGIGFDVHEDAASKGSDAVKFQGIKLSLFDVSNPRDMRELAPPAHDHRGGPPASAAEQLEPAGVEEHAQAVRRPAAVEDEAEVSTQPAARLTAEAAWIGDLLHGQGVVAQGPMASKASST
jgi:hypothetical protein